MSLLFVLALAVSCKNNTTDSTAGNTITYQMFEDQINAADETAVISKEGTSVSSFLDASLILDSIIFGVFMPLEEENDANTALTPETVKNGLDKAFAAIPDRKINYEITIPAITQDAKQEVTFTITFTPRNSNDKFDTASFQQTEIPDYITYTEKEVKCNISINAYWAAK